LFLSKKKEKVDKDYNLEMIGLYYRNIDVEKFIIRDVFGY
jgi:hypothetical protein